MKRHVAKIGVALLSVATLLTTAGCSTRAQQAFSVNGVVTSTSDVASMASGCATALGGDTSMISASGLVSDMIRADLARLVASQNNITYSDDELRQPIEAGSLGSLATMMLNDPSCAQLAMGLTLQVLASDQLGASVFQAATVDIPVTVNPRFGAWSPADMAVDGSGSLSQADS